MDVPSLRATKAVCCHCVVQCGVLVSVDGDRALGITGDPSHPASHGFICPRGRAALEYFEHPGRLSHPLKRVGSRGEGRWQRIGWAEAIDAIADQLERIRQRDGAEAVAHLAGTFHGPDHGIGVRFMNLFGSPNYGGTALICAGPKVMAETLTFGVAPASPDIVPGETGSIILWSRHPAASFAPHWGRILAARRAGAALIVIDPVRTDETRAADLWLQLRPGTDAALALGLLYVVVRDGLYDRSFVDRWTTGFEDLRERVAEYPPERVAAITGLAPSQIEACARLYATRPPAAISSGSPNGMGRNALSYEQAKAVLIAITGNLDRRGANRLFGPPERIQTMADMELCDTLPESQRRKQIGGHRFRLHVEAFPRINEATRRVWPHHRQVNTALFGGAAHPPSIFRAILDDDPYPVRALMLQYHNAIGAYPNARLVREALRSPNLELLVVHELFMTPTAQYADYVLPAASWLEKSYLYAGGWDTRVLATPRALTPRGERRNDYELFRDLGWRLGQKEFWPPTLEALWDEMLAPAGVTFAELTARERNWIADESPPERHARIDAATGETQGFTTPSRKVELAPSLLTDSGYDALPRFDDSLDDSPNADYPYVLMTGSTRIDTTHQDHRQIASLRRRHPDPTARMHPATAADLGIREGDWIWIETRLGRIRQRVRVTEDVHPSTIDAERWWHPERVGAEPELFGVFESNVNVLTDDDPGRCDPAYGSWPFRLGRCRVARAGPPM